MAVELQAQPHLHHFPNVIKFINQLGRLYDYNMCQDYENLLMYQQNNNYLNIGVNQL